MSDPRSVRRAGALMVVVVLVWGYAWIVAKMALAYCGPLELATLRTAVGVAVLFPVLLWTGGSIWPEHPWPTLGVGVLQTALFLLLNNWALEQGDVGKTSVLVFTMPFWVLVFAWPLLGERIRRLGWITVLVAAAGLICILEPWGLRVTLLAKLLAVLAGVSWALGVVTFKRLHDRYPVDVFNFTFWQMALGLIPMVVVAVLAHSRPVDWTGKFIVLLLFLGIVSTAVGWMAWFYVLRRLPAGTTSMSTLGVPVVALIASAVQLGERPTRLEFTGMLLIGLALALVSWDTMRQRRPVEPLMGQE